MAGPLSIPLLPSSWPYPLRDAGVVPERVAGLSIPGLGSGWTAFLRSSISFDVEACPLVHAFGRGGIQRLGDVVARPYRRGGLVRHFNARIYASPVRFAREFAVHWALWAAGFPTVEPLGYAFRRCLWGVEGTYFTRFVESQAWPACWDRSPEILPPLNVMLDALAAWGLHAPDLNATNILLTTEGQVLALDWDRAAWTGATDLRARYDGRLRRSLQKLGAPKSLFPFWALQ